MDIDFDGDGDDFYTINFIRLVKYVASLEARIAVLENELSTRAGKEHAVRIVE